MLVVCFCVIITSLTVSKYNGIWNAASSCAFYDVEEMDTI